MTLQSPGSVLPCRREAAPRRLRRLSARPSSRPPAAVPGPRPVPRVPERSEGEAVAALRHLGQAPHAPHRPPVRMRRRSARFLRGGAASALTGQAPAESGARRAAAPRRQAMPLAGSPGEARRERKSRPPTPPPTPPGALGRAVPAPLPAARRRVPGTRCPGRLRGGGAPCWPAGPGLGLGAARRDGGAGARPRSPAAAPRPPAALLAAAGARPLAGLRRGTEPALGWVPACCPPGPRSPRRRLPLLPGAAEGAAGAGAAGPAFTGSGRSRRSRSAGDSEGLGRGALLVAPGSSLAASVASVWFFLGCPWEMAPGCNEYRGAGFFSPPQDQH